MTDNRRRCARKVLRTSSWILGAAVLWFATTRLLSPFTAVSVVELGPAESGPAALDEIRVGCYNVAHGRGGRFGASNWESISRRQTKQHLRRIGQLLREQDLDVIVLNEVDFSAIWSGQFDQAEVVAEEIGMPFLVEQRNVDASLFGVNLKAGNAVLSRYPIAATERIVFPALSRFERVVVGSPDAALVTLDLPGGAQLRVLAVHLEVRSEAIRVLCARRILKIRDASDVPLVVAGDLNASFPGWPHGHRDGAGNNTLSVLFADGKFRTAPTGSFLPPDFTFPSQKPDRVIDWVLWTAPYSLVSKQVLRSDLSDHLPVIVTLRSSSPTSRAPVHGTLE